MSDPALVDVLYGSAANLIEALGFLAALLTLLAFAQRRMLPMRVAALGANLFFISYGVLGGYYPVLALHLVLLPMNLVRFFGEWLRERERRPKSVAPPEPGLMGWV